MIALCSASRSTLPAPGRRWAHSPLPGAGNACCIELTHRLGPNLFPSIFLAFASGGRCALLNQPIHMPSLPRVAAQDGQPLSMVPQAAAGQLAGMAFAVQSIQRQSDSRRDMILRELPGKKMRMVAAFRTWLDFPCQSDSNELMFTRARLALQQLLKGHPVTGQ